MIVYITEQGAGIYISGERIILKKFNNVIGVFLTKDIDQVVIMGNVSISTQAIKHFLKHKIDVVFTKYSGDFLGRLVPELGKNIILRRLQITKLGNPKIKLKLAKNIIKAKVENSISVLRKLNYYHKDESVTTILNRLTVFKKQIVSIADIKSLLGFEGTAANLYFGAFDFLIKGNLKFEKRTKRPPLNEVNALLSFGYTILGNVVRTAVNTVGLDPYFGCYHVEEYGRPSMVLDLMEEFRAVAIDYLVISSLNKGMVNKNDFIIDYENHDLPVSMSVYGRKKYIGLLEKRFNSYFWYEEKNKKMTLREIIRYQAYKFAKAIIEDSEYKGFTF
ncbi:MAG: CRISP-associated protein Cas1 [Deferribacteres bacterium]|jgi:CRISPR-associated protein Cas1|nr:CRISPR-associated protein Cas1 [Deferribacteraceae bacterium]MDK2792940.1 CRISP-associated protein Cas1 [Deferribacteres bacterium]